jgi:hypothetical protein
LPAAFSRQDTRKCPSGSRLKGTRTQRTQSDRRPHWFIPASLFRSLGQILGLLVVIIDHAAIG